MLEDFTAMLVPNSAEDANMIQRASKQAIDFGVRGIPLAVTSAGVGFANLPIFVANKVFYSPDNQADYIQTANIASWVDSKFENDAAFTSYYNNNEKGVELAGAITGGIATFPVGGAVFSLGSKLAMGAAATTQKLAAASLLGGEAGIISKTASAVTGLAPTTQKARALSDAYTKILSGETATATAFLSATRARFATATAADWAAQGLAYEAVAIGAMITNPTYDNVKSIGDFAKEVSSGALLGGVLGGIGGAAFYKWAKIAPELLPAGYQAKPYALKDFAEIIGAQNTDAVTIGSRGNAFGFSNSGNAIVDIINSATPNKVGGIVFEPTTAEVAFMNSLPRQVDKDAYLSGLKQKVTDQTRAFDNNISSRLLELSKTPGVADLIRKPLISGEPIAKQYANALVDANEINVTKLGISDAEKNATRYLNLNSGQISNTSSQFLGDLFVETAEAGGKKAVTVNAVGDVNIVAGANAGQKFEIGELVLGTKITSSNVYEYQAAWQYAKDYIANSGFAQKADLLDSPYALAARIEAAQKSTTNVMLRADGTVVKVDDALVELHAAKKEMYTRARSAGATEEDALLFADLPDNAGVLQLNSLPLPRNNNFSETKNISILAGVPEAVPSSSTLTGYQSGVSLIGDKVTAAVTAGENVNVRLELGLQSAFNFGNIFNSIRQLSNDFQTSIEASLFAGADAKFGSIAYYAKSIGQSINLAKSRMFDVTQQMLRPEISAMLREIEQGVGNVSAQELQILHQRVQNSNSRLVHGSLANQEVQQGLKSFGLDIENVLVDSSRFVELRDIFASSKLTGKDATYWQKIVTQAVAEIDATKIVLAQDSPVNRLLQTYIGRENAIRSSSLELYAGRGMNAAKIQPGEIYFPPPSSATHPFWAVIEDSASTAAEGVALKSSLHARTEQELAQKIKNLAATQHASAYTITSSSVKIPDSYGIRTIQDISRDKKVEGVFDVDKVFSSFNLDTTLKREGVYGEYLLPPKDILNSMLEHLRASGNRVVRDTVVNANPQIIAELETASSVTSAYGRSIKGSTSQQKDVLTSDDQ